MIDYELTMPAARTVELAVAELRAEVTVRANAFEVAMPRLEAEVMIGTTVELVMP